MFDDLLLLLFYYITRFGVLRFIILMILALVGLGFYLGRHV